MTTPSYAWPLQDSCHFRLPSHVAILPSPDTKLALLLPPADIDDDDAHRRAQPKARRAPSKKNVAIACNTPLLLPPGNTSTAPIATPSLMAKPVAISYCPRHHPHRCSVLSRRISLVRHLAT
ncbi:hypothetical protein NL676_005242 [Syzygium grande]|nr:hypothetical protein NL676_005242 [Syzygium grande]